MNQILETIANEPVMIMGLALGPLAMITLYFIVEAICRATVKGTAEKEQSRRELAAYVAEGSMTAQDAEKLLDPRPWYASWWTGNES